MARGMFNLGVTLPAVLGLLFMACSLWRSAIARRLRASAWLRRAWWLGWAALAMWLVSLLVFWAHRSEEHTSELQSPCNLVCRLLLEKKKKKQIKSNLHVSQCIPVSITCLS